MPVTRHPLRRSGREALPHPAPTLGLTASVNHRGWPLGWLVVHASASGTRAPGSASGTCDVPHVPLGHRPSLHPLRGPSWRIVRGLLRYYVGVWLLRPVHHRRRDWLFPMRTTQPSRGQSWALPVPVQGVYAHAKALRPRRAREALAVPCSSVLPSTRPPASALWT